MIFEIQRDGSAKVLTSHTQADSRCIHYAVLPKNPNVYTKVNFILKPALYDSKEWLLNNRMVKTQEPKYEYILE